MLHVVNDTRSGREGVTLGEAETLGEAPPAREGLALAVALPVAVSVGEAVVVAVSVRVLVVRGDSEITREPLAPTLPEVVLLLVGLG